MVRLDSSGPTENLTTRIHTVWVPMYSFLLPAGEPFPATAWIVSRTLLLRATKTWHQNISKCAWILHGLLCVISILHMECMKGKLERYKFPMRTFFTEVAACEIWRHLVTRHQITGSEPPISIFLWQAKQEWWNTLFNNRSTTFLPWWNNVRHQNLVTLLVYTAHQNSHESRLQSSVLARIYFSLFTEKNHTWAPTETVVLVG